MRRFLVLAFVALACPAGAQAPDCADPQTQSALNACADQGARAADDRLNAVYATLRQRLAADTAGLGLLRDAQRAWIAFRDAECTFGASGAEGGTAQPMVRSRCLWELTRKRADDLSQYLGCSEGDLACPLAPR